MMQLVRARASFGHWTTANLIHGVSEDEGSLRKKPQTSMMMAAGIHILACLDLLCIQ